MNPVSGRALRAYGESFLVVGACTAVNWFMFRRFELANLAMVYLLGVVYVATRHGRGPSIFATVLGVLVFDFFYVPPYFSIITAELRYFALLPVMIVVGVVISTLTERARVREQETEHARMEIEVERQRNALLSVVSHDLRTPLASITGSAEALLDPSGQPSEEIRRELLQSIAGEANRLSRLVTNLLDITRMESGSVKLDKQWGLIEEVVGSALARLETQLEDRKVLTHLGEDSMLVAYDPVLTEQVFINLLENAIRHSPPGSEIAISAHKDKEAVTVEVADRGRGIPAGEEEKIFEKFHRAPGAAIKWGAGLGLTICRAVIKAHGGRIWAENRPGGGAVFRFTLPSGEPPPVPPTEPPTEPSSIP
jgi:two-component system sensor histidine kinase KdpD